MKKIYRPLIKGTNWALAGLLGLMGFSCDNSGEEPVVCMYGVPWATHAVKGTVVDKATGKPIEGIEVKVAIPDSIMKELSWPNMDTWKAITNSKGEYKLKDTPPSFSEEGLPIAAIDIDAEKNGSFQSDTIYIDTTQGEHVPENPNQAWFNGEWVSTADFKLDELKDE